MSIQIINDECNAVMFCNTSDWAFGPVAYEPYAREQLAGFLVWLDQQGQPDPRTIPDSALETLWGEFQQFIDHGGGE